MAEIAEIVENLPGRNGGSVSPALRPSWEDRWAHLLDDALRIPGTRITFGLDVLLGVVPVVGDFAGLACGLPLVAAAVRRRLPLVVVVAMLVNVLVDAMMGSIPVIGDVFDLFWKSHRKNLELLKSPEALGLVAREAWWKLAGLVAVLFLLVVLAVYLVVAVLSAYLHFFHGWLP